MREQWSGWLGVLVLGVTCFATAVPIPSDTSMPTGQWLFHNAPEVPGAIGSLTANHKGVFRLDYDFTAGGRYAGLRRTFEAPAYLDDVSFRVRKPAEAVLVVRATDSDGQVFQKTLSIPSTTWRAVIVGLRSWGGHDASFHGGHGDGVFRPPVQSLEILVDARGLKEGKGKVLLADLSLKASSPQPSGTPKDTFDAACRVTDFGEDTPFELFGQGERHGQVWKPDLQAGETGSLYGPITLPGEPTELSLKVRGGEPGHRLEVVLWSRSQEFKRSLELTGREKTFTMPAPPADGWTFGAKDPKETPKVVRYPLRFVALGILRGDGPAVPTQVELLELRCRTQAPLSRAVTLVGMLKDVRSDGGVRTLTADCTGKSLLDKEATGTLTLTARNWDGEIVHEQAVSWTLPPGGAPAKGKWKVTVPGTLKFAEVEFRFESPKTPTATTRAAFAAPLEGVGDAISRPDSPWGMNVCHYRYPNTSEGMQGMEKISAMAQAAGVKWTREEFAWVAIEPKRGEFDFRFQDAVVETIQRHGVSVLGLLAYWSKWTTPYTDEGIEDYCRYARAVVTHFKDRVKYWEVYNEPNIAFWKGPKELYPVLLKRCYAAIKEADPDAVVVGLDLAGIDLEFLGMCRDSRAPFDVLSVHPYRPTLVEDRFIDELQSTSAIIGERPLWITEMGWSTVVGNVDERMQAQCLARAYLSAAASGACRKVFWYDFRNDGEDAFENEHNFGILNRDLTLKPAYRALATVCRTFATGTPMLREDFGRGVCALEMGGALALWCPNDTAQVKCRVGNGDLRAVNLMGEDVNPERNGTHITIRLRPDCPIFLSGAPVKSLGSKVTKKDAPPQRF